MQNDPRVIALARLIPAFYALLNAYLLSQGYNPMPFSEEKVAGAINVAIGIFGTLYVWWKNNNITKEAQVAQVYLDEMKEGKQ